MLSCSAQYLTFLHLDRKKNTRLSLWKSFPKTSKPQHPCWELCTHYAVHFRSLFCTCEVRHKVALFLQMIMLVGVWCGEDTLRGLAECDWKWGCLDLALPIRMNPLRWKTCLLLMGEVIIAPLQQSDLLHSKVIQHWHWLCYRRSSRRGEEAKMPMWLQQLERLSIKQNVLPGDRVAFFSPVMLMSVSVLYNSRRGSMENADSWGNYGCTLDRLRWLLIQNDYAPYSLLWA